MFTPGGLLIGLMAALLAGVSKTGLPGVNLVAIPLVALVVEGRLIPGASLPILIFADLFAVVWYHRHTRWDVLGGLAPWLGGGFVVGIVFFIVIGSATRQLEVGIGLVLLVIVALQLWYTLRGTEARGNASGRAGYGIAGGFTTFVANAAGPVVNTYLASLRLPKSELLGTAAVLYFAVNLAKVPFYLALGAWTEGGPFFTAESIAWNLTLVPGVIAGVYLGRLIYNRIPQRAFLVAVLVLSAAGALALVV